MVFEVAAAKKSDSSIARSVIARKVATALAGANKT